MAEKQADAQNGAKNHDITLHYFDLAGGGEPIRLAFTIGGIPFKDRRITFQEWPSVKPSMPLAQVPVLEVDGKMITQCLAHLRFAGAVSGLVPKDPIQALKLDEIIYVMQDLTSSIGRTISMEPGEARAAIRRKWLATEFPSFMMHADRELGTDDLKDAPLNIVDLMLYSRVKWWSCGVLDNVPEECCTPYKNILRRVDLVTAHPKVQEWNRTHLPKKTDSCPANSESVETNANSNTNDSSK